MLLLLMCIPGIALSASHGDMHWFSHGFSMNEDNMDEFLGDRHESDQSIEQAIPAGTALLVNNPHGDITITGSSDDGMMSRRGAQTGLHTLGFRCNNQGRTALRLNWTVSGGLVTLSVPAVDGGRADLTITLPTTTMTTATADHGSIHVSSLKAPVTITANHGDIEVNAIGGAVVSHMNNRGSSFNARGVRGGVTLEGDCHDVDISDVTGAVSLHGDFFGKTHFERVSGSVRFHTQPHRFPSSAA